MLLSPADNGTPSSTAPSERPTKRLCTPQWDPHQQQQQQQQQLTPPAQQQHQLTPSHEENEIMNTQQSRQTPQQHTRQHKQHHNHTLNQRPPNPSPQPLLPLQYFHQQHGAMYGTPPLASGTTAVLPTALPVWAQGALCGVDPFWQPHETLAVVVTQLAGPAPGTHGQLQSASALFTVSTAALTAIKQGTAQARLVCVQPRDEAPNRCHWYAGSHVLLNGQPYYVTKEDRTELMLGPTQNDQATDLSRGLIRAANRLTLLWPSGVAGAVAVLRLCTPLQAAYLATRLAPPLSLTAAAAAVAAYVGGGKSEGHMNGEGGGRGSGGEDEGIGKQEEGESDIGGGGGEGVEEGYGETGDQPAGAAVADSKGPVTAAAAATAVGVSGGGDRTPGPHDGTAGGGGEDEGVGAGLVTVSLRCPLTGALVRQPAHFGATANCAPVAFFDAHAFLELARGSGSWVCPVTRRRGGLEDMRPHAYLTAVLRTLDHNGIRERVEAIQVGPCGGWRPKDSRLSFLSVLPGGGGADSPEGDCPPSFDPQLLDPEDGPGAGVAVVDLTDD